MLKQVNTVTTAPWSLEHDRPILSTGLVTSRSKLADWIVQLRPEYVKMVAIGQLPLAYTKQTRHKPFTMVVSDGQVARILPLCHLTTSRLMLEELMMNEDIMKVTLGAADLLEHLWHYDLVETRNLVDLRDIGWPGRPDGLGGGTTYAEAFEALNQYATNYIQLCALQQTSQGDMADCRYQRYDGKPSPKKSIVHLYVPRPIIGAARRAIIHSKTPSTAAQNSASSTSTAMHSSNSSNGAVGIGRTTKRLTTKQVIAALESYEKTRTSSMTSSHGDVDGDEERGTMRAEHTSKDKPKMRKVARRTVSSAMDTAFKSIFDQMSTYKSNVEKRIDEDAPPSSTSITASTAVKVEQQPTADAAQVEHTLQELTELLKDPQRLQLLQQLIALLKQPTSSLSRSLTSPEQLLMKLRRK
ncbi:hypothetical protein SYNPS1DRAFT_29610 [Syncephalis pseudoplumigaleata]|uniref:Uncharacterized protein n=1 Tax=Syncephalis pseudoplumigaleata TaxID=1712513 RepID=A0A4P9YZ18_9FUNG|nr:hypothetical protein SYNPS1DRAFT_29610 [Syncephalis pseudoplumigaleata]|eukprot:RKP24631.1 hypothetical protein SYNPS1DRAFT_29610 [Syncephalis pseudoplumigaleata]